MAKEYIITSEVQMKIFLIAAERGERDRNQELCTIGLLSCTIEILWVAIYQTILMLKIQLTIRLKMRCCKTYVFIGEFLHHA